MNGKIIKYFSRRGFGFISPENSQEEIFFHVSNYPELVQPEIGKDVEFELIETPKGKEATQIKILPDALAPEPPEAEEEEAEEEEAEEEEAEEEEAEEEEAEEEEAEEEEAEEEEAESPKASILEIAEIKGVGKTTEEKLRKAGFDTVESIASVDAETVSEKTGISSKVAAKLIASAKEFLD
jgi:cold shock CspA family protein